MNRPFLALSEIRVEEQKTLAEQDMLSFTHKYFSGKYLGMIRRDNMLFFRQGYFVRALQKAFPRLVDISVQIQRKNTLVIRSNERSPHSLWCIDREYGTAFEEECYYADRTGILYARAPYFSGDMYMKVFFAEDLLDGGNILGQSLYQDEDLHTFFEFLNELETRFNLNAVSVFIDTSYDYQIFLSRVQGVRYEGPYPYILFQRNESYDIILRNLEIMFDFDVFKQDFRQRPQALESLDVRFPGRVFFTFSDER